MLRYVTTNPGKVREAEEYLGDDAVAQLDYDYTEIQSDDLGTIAARGAREAYRHAGEPVLVDDAGLFVRGFDGFEQFRTFLSAGDEKIGVFASFDRREGGYDFGTLYRDIRSIVDENVVASFVPE